jgi:protein-S-isoprenylcysteine O-methyltransferase Ste14
MHDLPLLVVALTVSAYWIGVGAMINRVRRHRRRDAGLVPEQARERAMWFVWVPLVAAWVALPWLARTRTDGILALPAFAQEDAFFAVRTIAAAAAVLCWVATLRCYQRNGRRLAHGRDVPRDRAHHRWPVSPHPHPIYAFSILLMLASVVVLPTLPMLAIALVHVTLMNLKARNEEAHLAAMHGADYARYAARTGRFMPRFTTREP